MSEGILLTDYLIPHEGVDWTSALGEWDWLLPEGDLTLWLVNRLADMFFVYADGSVHLLDVARGTLERVAVSRDDFATRLNDTESAYHWLMIPLVNQLRVAGIQLAPGECYGFRRFPMFGGDYEVENFAPISVESYVAGCGSLHAQLKDVPDGTELRIKPE